jgi:hypothetical protein
MKRRTRTLAGSLALMAMALSVTESVLGSVCAPVTAMADMADMADMPGMGGQSMAAGGDARAETMTGMPMPVPDRDGGREASEGDDHCPLAPALGQGCSAVASLPAAPSRDGSPTTLGALRTSFDDIRPELLLAHTLFRPPRA